MGTRPQKLNAHDQERQKNKKKGKRQERERERWDKRKEEVETGGLCHMII